MQTSLFPLSDDIDFLIFSQTELGQLFQAIPFEELAKPFKNYARQFPQGKKSVFSIEGAIGLMFLKHYLNLSDEKLIHEALLGALKARPGPIHPIATAFNLGKL